MDYSWPSMFDTVATQESANALLARFTHANKVIAGTKDTT